MNLPQEAQDKPFRYTIKAWLLSLVKLTVVLDKAVDETIATIDIYSDLRTVASCLTSTMSAEAVHDKETALAALGPIPDPAPEQSSEDKSS